MKRYPVVSTIIALICVVILLKLGFWQLSRADEKREIQEALTAKQAIVYPDLLSALNAETENNYKSVQISGDLNNKKLLYWDNRVVNGKPGYEVLAALQSNAGFVLVNLGWVEDKSFRQSIPQVTLPDVLIKVTGTLYAPVNNVLVKEQNDSSDEWPKRIQQPDLAELEALLGVPLLPTVAYLKNSEAYGLINNFRPVTMSPAKHIGYAIQWFCLALACLVVYILALKKYAINNNRTDENTKDD